MPCINSRVSKAVPACRPEEAERDCGQGTRSLDGQLKENAPRPAANYLKAKSPRREKPVTSYFKNCFAAMPVRDRTRRDEARREGVILMQDIIFLACTVGFFVLAIAYVWACDRLR